MKNKIFLSYSDKDKSWARELAARLSDKGINVWFDPSEINLGEKISATLQEGLRSSSVLVVILSANVSMKSWVYFEVGAAIADNKGIIPVIIDESGKKNLQFPLDNFQYLNETSPSKAAEEIVKILKQTKYK